MFEQDNISLLHLCRQMAEWIRATGSLLAGVGVLRLGDGGQNMDNNGLPPPNCSGRPDSMEREVRGNDMQWTPSDNIAIVIM